MISRTLETLANVGRSEVALPLSTQLFGEPALVALAGEMPGLQFADGRLILLPGAEAERVLREALQRLYLPLL